MWEALQIAFIGAAGVALILGGILQLYGSRIVWTPRQPPSPAYRIMAGLFFLFFFSSVVFMDARFDSEPPVMVAIAALAWLVSTMRKNWPFWTEWAQYRRRLASRDDPPPAGSPVPDPAPLSARPNTHRTNDHHTEQ